MFPKILSVILSLFVLTSDGSMHTTNTPAWHVLAQKEYSLSDRHTNDYVNTVFSDNILLTLSYLDGDITEGSEIDWNTVKEDATYKFVLAPHKTFAFHDEVFPQYKDTLTKTTNAHFNSREGFKSDGVLIGDGVCHLASFMNVTAREAGLTVESPTKHNFAIIPEVSKENGVSILYNPNNLTSSRQQNLYITNSLENPVVFVITHTGDNLTISVVEIE